MKIAITGGNGQLAKSLHSLDNQHITLLAKNNLDVTDSHSVEAYFLKHKPDWIFHLASITRGDDNVKNPELAHKVNVIGTENVVKIAKQLDVPLLFVSTNEVFDGLKTTPYSETDKPNPITQVGRHKLEAENIIQNTLDKYLIIRTMWTYSNWSANFIHAIIKIAKEKAELSLVSDEIGSPTSSLDLSKAILAMVRKNIHGLFHVTNDGEASRYDFGVEVLKRIGLINKTKINSVKLSDFHRLSYPPKYSVLNNQKAREKGVILRDWKEALHDFLSNNKV